MGFLLLLEKMKDTGKRKKTPTDTTLKHVTNVQVNPLISLTIAELEFQFPTDITLFGHAWHHFIVYLSISLSVRVFPLKKQKTFSFYMLVGDITTDSAHKARRNESTFKKLAIMTCTKSHLR